MQAVFAQNLVENGKSFLLVSKNIGRWLKIEEIKEYLKNVDMYFIYIYIYIYI